MKRVLLFGLAAVIALMLVGCTRSSETVDVSMSPTGEGAVSGLSVAVVGEHTRFTPSEIRVKRGETVTVRFTSNEGIHDWVLDEFDAATSTVSAGETTSVTFVADKVGTFEYYCSIANHRQQGMVGRLTVE